MDYEIQKIDQRIAFLRRREAGRINALQAQKKLINGVSI